MYSKIIDLYFSTAGEELTAGGESAENHDPMEIMPGECFILRVHFITSVIKDGVLIVNSVGIADGIRAEARGISAAGEVLFAAGGHKEDNSLLFTLNTSTDEFRNTAAEDSEQDCFIVFANVATADSSHCVLGRVPFRSIAPCDWSMPPPAVEPPEYLSKGAVMVLWKNYIEFFFSRDRAEWHREYSPSDIFFRIGRAGGGSGPALPVPSCGNICIDDFGSTAERPPADAGCRFFLDDSTGMISVSDGKRMARGISSDRSGGQKRG